MGCFLILKPVVAEQQVYRVKRSGETISAPAVNDPAPSKPITEGQASPSPMPVVAQPPGPGPMGSIPPVAPSKRPSVPVYEWESDRTKVTKTGAPKPTYATPTHYVNHEVFDSILEKYVNKNGWVDYRGLKRDKWAKAKLEAYVKDLAEMDPSTLEDDSDRIASWLNLYNAMVLQELLKHYPVKNLMRIPDFFGKRRFKVGGEEMSLIEIDREIFKKQIREPRTVLARVNGAASGPRLMREAFSGSKLEKQLEERTWKFLVNRANVDFEPQTKTLILNPTFLWYQEEFGDLLLFLKSYLDLMPTVYNITYRGYDWALNDEKLH